MGMKFIREVERVCDKLVSASANVIDSYDPTELESFAKKLSGLGGLTVGQVCDQLNDVDVPRNFLHFELHNVTDDIGIATYYSGVLEPLCLYDMIAWISVFSDSKRIGNRVWYETVALPVTRPGVLRLGLKLRPREPKDSTEDWVFPRQLFRRR